MEIPATISDDELLRPIVTKSGTYENPFKTWTGMPRFSNMMKFMKERITGSGDGGRGSSPLNQRVLDETLPIRTPDKSKLENPPPDKIQYMWIGHASCLIQMNGVNVLTDPIWSDRCSPISFMGPKRYRAPPLTIAELPNIDAVVISHNHYDHLDKHTVYKLNERFNDNLRWFVPLGLRRWFTDSGCSNVTELSWWQSSSLTDQVEIICTPAQHWSLRTGCDRNQSLWSSWVIRSPERSFFFSGDTAYCEAFEQIGIKYGPFNLAAIAIGAYCPRYFMKPQHVDPEHAYQIHNDIKSNLTFGIHWGTFPMGSTEPYLEPRELIAELQEGQSEKRFITVEHGDVRKVE